MGILVMDTATDALGVAVGQLDGTPLASVVQRVARGHSRLLQPSLQFAMQSAGVIPADIAQIGVGIGPGSYTGVRMAVATGKAMAVALQVPLVTISTLDAMAFAAHMAQGQDGFAGDDGAAAGMTAVSPAAIVPETRVLPLLYARRQRAFGAHVTFVNGRLHARTATAVRDIQAWLADLDASGAGRCPTVIVHDLPPQAAAPLAAYTGRITAVHWRRLSACLPFALLSLTASGQYPVVQGEALHAVEPDYALPVEAEAKLQARQGERE